SGTAPVPLARKPNVVVPAGARAPFQLSFRTVTDEPDAVCLPPQIWLIVPEPVQETAQPVMGSVPAFATVTSAWYPPLQELTTLNSAVQPPVGAGWSVVVNVTLPDGGEVLPAASLATTYAVYSVPGVSPVRSKVVPVAVPAFSPSR